MSISHALIDNPFSSVNRPVDIANADLRTVGKFYLNIAGHCVESRFQEPTNEQQVVNPAVEFLDNLANLDDVAVSSGSFVPATLHLRHDRHNRGVNIWLSEVQTLDLPRAFVHDSSPSVGTHCSGFEAAEGKTPSTAVVDPTGGEPHEGGEQA